jgi:hypothetical protein
LSRIEDGPEKCYNKFAQLLPLSDSDSTLHLDLCNMFDEYVLVDQRYQLLQFCHVAIFLPGYIWNMLKPTEFETNRIRAASNAVCGHRQSKFWRPGNDGDFLPLLPTPGEKNDESNIKKSSWHLNLENSFRHDFNLIENPVQNFFCDHLVLE